jgi:membrane fusion protein, multidrug efflux system
MPRFSATVTASVRSSTSSFWRTWSTWTLAVASVLPMALAMSLLLMPGLWVDANFKEDQLAAMRPGQTASITADVLPDHPFQGRVLSLARGTGAVFSVIPPENATGNFTKIVQRVPVRIALDLRDSGIEMLRPGLSITASVDTRSTPHVP